MPNSSPVKLLTFLLDTLLPVEFHELPDTTRRTGKPRFKWVPTTLERLWTVIGRTIRPEMNNISLDLENEERIDIIQHAAKNNFEGFIPRTYEPVRS